MIHMGADGRAGSCMPLVRGRAMNRDELIVLVGRMRESNYASDEEGENEIEILNANVIDPSAMDYIFQKKCEDMPLEEIVEKMLSYKPMQL